MYDDDMSLLKRYRPIPETVYAVQYTGTITAEMRTLCKGLDIQSQANSNGRMKLIACASDGEPVVLDVGEWLVRLDGGEYSKLSAAEFAQRYREV